jgi:hypothetical protein
MIMQLCARKSDYIFYYIFDLIDWCLMSSEQFFSYIQDDITFFKTYFVVKVKFDIGTW